MKKDLSQIFTVAALTIVILFIIIWNLFLDPNGTIDILTGAVGSSLGMAGIIYLIYMISGASGIAGSSGFSDFNPRSIVNCVLIYFLYAIISPLSIVLWVIAPTKIALPLILLIGAGLISFVYRFTWVRYLMKNIRNLNEESLTCFGEFLLFIFVPVYSCYWMFSRSDKLYNAANNRGMNLSNKKILNLIFAVFGLEIVSLCLMQSDLNKILISEILKSNQNKAKNPRSFDRAAFIAEAEKTHKF